MSETAYVAILFLIVSILQIVLFKLFFIIGAYILQQERYYESAWKRVEQLKLEPPTAPPPSIAKKT